MVGNGEIRTKQLEPVIAELLLIVGVYHLWDPKSVHDVLPDKIPGILLSNLWQLAKTSSVMELEVVVRVCLFLTMQMAMFYSLVPSRSNGGD